MKFMKGVMVGTLISAGMLWMYSGKTYEKKKLMKKGKKILKEMGM